MDCIKDKKRLAIVLTHPIQYYSPLFQKISRLITLKVFYTAGKESFENQFDSGFKKVLKWDIPLLKGYEYIFLKNNSKAPNLDKFIGVKNNDLISELKLFQPNAILFYGWSYYSHLKAIRYFKGKIPVWFKGDSTLLDDQTALKAGLRTIWLKWVYGYVDLAFYVGTANKAYFKKYGLKEHQLIFAPHAIDNERFGENRSIEAEKLRKYLGIPKHELLILFAGKLEVKKDPFILLNAFIELNKPDAHLLFVGNGDLEESLKFSVESLEKHLNQKVHFLDFQNQTQMPVVYQACDLFCLPSKGPGETWGLAVNEAMAAGKAILISDKVGCSTDLVVDGKNGYTFKAADFEDFKEKLYKIISTNEDLVELGKCSKQMILKRNYDAVAEIICAALINRDES